MFLSKGSLEVAAEGLLLGRCAGGAGEAPGALAGQPGSQRGNRGLVVSTLLCRCLQGRLQEVPGAERHTGAWLQAGPQQQGLPALKVARHWGWFPRETMARNTICQR